MRLVLVEVLHVQVLSLSQCFRASLVASASLREPLDPVALNRPDLPSTQTGGAYGRLPLVTAGS